MDEISRLLAALDGVVEDLGEEDREEALDAIADWADDRKMTMLRATGDEDDGWGSDDGDDPEDNRTFLDDEDEE